MQTEPKSDAKMRSHVLLILAHGEAHGWPLHETFWQVMRWLDHKGFEPPEDLKAFMAGRETLRPRGVTLR